MGSTKALSVVFVLNTRRLKAVLGKVPAERFDYVLATKNGADWAALGAKT